MTHRATARSTRLGLIVVALALAVSGTGSAHTTNSANGYFDGFDRVGPLPAGVEDPWQVVTGDWKVSEQAVVTGIPSAGTSKVLVQGSRAATPDEPIAFVRARPFRSLTAQVTAALIDDVSNASLGIVFRAPIDPDSGLADKDNLYLFSAGNTGIVGPFTTGHAFTLFKRIGRGYFMQTEQIVNTRIDLKQPHDYKVVMSGGRIQCFVDGRLVIDHTDVPSGDQPTKADPLPGLPFNDGAVGLRTSSARAWFDNFKVVGNDAYEARAAVSDSHVSYSNDATLRQGYTLQQSNVTRAGDTGFVYHDHDFDESIIEPFENPGGSPAGGASLRTFARDGVVTSEARLAGLYATFTDISRRVTVTMRINSAEMIATASCGAAGSHLVFYDAEWSAQIAPTESGSGFSVGPFPIKGELAPNTILGELPGSFAIIGNVRSVSTQPRRVEATTIEVRFFDNEVAVGPFSVTLPVVGTAGTGRVGTGRAPSVEYKLGHVVAGRYC